jgi:hypothetical protein
MGAWGCSPDIVKQETVTNKRLSEVRQDTVKEVNLRPSTEITDESATFVAMPSVETIDTVIKAEGTLRNYHVKITRETTPEKVIDGDSIKIQLKPKYNFEFTPEKPDSLFEKVTSTKTRVYKGRQWYEIPVFVAFSLISFILGLIIGRKFL